MLFLLNLLKNLNLCTIYIKQIMNVFSFVQWNKYFHSVKDEMYYSTRLCLVECKISFFASWKYLYHCTQKHSLFVYYYLSKITYPPTHPYPQTHTNPHHNTLIPTPSDRHTNLINTPTGPPTHPTTLSSSTHTNWLPWKQVLFFFKNSLSRIHSVHVF